jgi:hypothetical protein
MSEGSPLTAATAGVLLFAVGLAIGGGTLLTNRHEQQALEGWQRAEGTVVDLLKRQTPEGVVTIPLIAFTTNTGDRISFAPGAGATHGQYYVTHTVPVLYHPGHPQDARIDSRARRWTRNALAGAAALMLVGLGGYVAWYASRWQPPAPPQT